MIPYILIAGSLGLTLLVAYSRTIVAPILVACALIGNIGAVELARGWATFFNPPRQGIVYGAALGKYVLIAEIETPSEPRLYRVDYYPPEIEGELKEGVLFYDLDAVKPETGDGTGEAFEDMTGDDFTALERHLGEK